MNGLPLTRVVLCVTWLAIVGTGSLPAAGFTLPAPIELPDVGDNPNPGYTFQPFGWSPDGMFAYLETRADDDEDGTNYSYVVVDAVHDREVYRHEDDSLDWPDSTEDSAAESWRRSGAEISAKLATFGIRQMSGIVVSPFPMDGTEDRYTTDLEVADEPEADEFSSARIQSYTLTLVSQTHGEEHVADKNGVDAADVRVEGRIASPWEPLILIVVSERKRVLEQYRQYLAFYGAPLPAGVRIERHE